MYYKSQQHIVKHKMNTHYKNIHVIQVPDKDNGYHAAYEVCLTSSTGQVICAVGEAKGKCDKDVEGLLQKAVQNGYEIAKSMLESNTVQNKEDTSAYQKWSENSPLSIKNTNKSFAAPKNAGGGSKPISPKQKNLIHTRCLTKSIDSESYIRDKFGTDLNSLNGAQADQLIKELL